MDGAVLSKIALGIGLLVALAFVGAYFRRKVMKHKGQAEVEIPEFLSGAPQRRDHASGFVEANWCEVFPPPGVERLRNKR